MSIGTYGGKIKKEFAKKVQIFYHSRRLRGKLRRSGQDCIHRDNRTFMQIFFLNFMIFLTFLYIERKVSGLSPKRFSEIVITEFLMSRGTYWGKIEYGLFENSINFIYFSEAARKVSAGGQDCIHCDNTIFMQTIFLNYMFFTIFVLWAKNFRPFIKSSSVRL